MNKLLLSVVLLTAASAQFSVSAISNEDSAQLSRLSSERTAKEERVKALHNEIAELTEKHAREASAATAREQAQGKAGQKAPRSDADAQSLRKHESDIAAKKAELNRLNSEIGALTERHGRHKSDAHNRAAARRESAPKARARV